MQRRLFLWGLVVSWVVGTPGMAWGLTLDVDSFLPSCQLQISQMSNLTWDSAGYPGGRRGEAQPGQARGNRTGMNHVQRPGSSGAAALATPNPVGPGAVAAFRFSGPPEWRRKVNYLGLSGTGNWLDGWLAVTGTTPDLAWRIFPGGLGKSGLEFPPGFENLGGNESPCPIPGSGFLLLASGMLGVAGMSKKFIF
jgi:hypothetical protein